ncbi:Retrovirus-related Pol polyprotein from type-1 retrotransposable element R2 [Chionoecetes opilio]|uniref:Retrovirus-related Pol polyprotein from type-1 retrotransposable element R2 n=1 Tax=Chionoecetes opilio TaxID=41210 RepID=A0A8J5CRJ0_CHIOP|nr:Retrovirus-related Pol polyprotein from type-1 retrotransposable element R2 [Chionoecetes opilio]
MFTFCLGGSADCHQPQAYSTCRQYDLQGSDEAYFGPGQLGYVSQGAVKMKYKGLQGMTSHRGLSILPQDPPDAIRPKPRFSVIAGNQNPHGGPGVAPKPAVSQVKAALQESQNPQIQPAVLYIKMSAPSRKGVSSRKGMKLKSLSLQEKMKVLARMDAGPAVVERPAPPVAANNQPLAPPANVEHEDIHNEVLAPPPVQAGRLVSDMDGQMARWAEYFGQLFTVDPPTEQLHTTGLQAVDADPPIDETAPSLDEVREAVAKLKGGKAAGVCNSSAELLKAGGEAMIRGLHAVLTAVWQSGVRQGCVLAPSLFNACMDWVLDKVVDQSDCGASVGNTKITDLVFADDAVIFAESLEVLVMALEALHEEAKPLGLEVSWLKTKVQVSYHACYSIIGYHQGSQGCSRGPRSATNNTKKEEEISAIMILLPAASAEHHNGHPIKPEVEQHPAIFPGVRGRR